MKVGNQQEGTVTTSGTAAVIHNNQIAIDTGDVHQKLDAKNLDLESAKPFLPDSQGIDIIAGTVDLHLAVDLTAGKNAALDLLIANSKPISIGGRVLNGDTLTTNSLTIQIPSLNDVFPDGVSHWQSGRIKVGTDAGPLLVKIDQGQITMLADLTPQSILNMLAQKPPGAAGQLAVVSDFDLQKIIPQLKNVIPQLPGTTIQSAGFSQNLKLEMTPNKTDFSNVVDTTRVVGTQTVAGSGKTNPISIDQINISITGAELGGGGGSSLPDLQNMDLKIASKAANGEFKGQSLADLTGLLTVNLGLLHDELAQFIDFKNQAFSGTLVAKMKEKGDLAQLPFRSTAQLTVTGTDLHFSNPDHPNLVQPRIELDTTADLQGSGSNTIETIDSLLVTVKSGSAQAVQLSLPHSGVSNLVARKDLNLDLGIDYDLAQIWAIVQPLMGDKYKSLKITGHFKSSSASPAVTRQVSRPRLRSRRSTPTAIWRSPHLITTGSALRISFCRSPWTTGNW